MENVRKSRTDYNYTKNKNGKEETKMKKKIVSVMMAGMLAVSLAGCSGELSNGLCDSDTV